MDFFIKTSRLSRVCFPCWETPLQTREWWPGRRLSVTGADSRLTGSLKGPPGRQIPCAVLTGTATLRCPLEFLIPFPGGPVVKNLSASAGDVGSLPGPRRSALLRRRWGRGSQPPSCGRELRRQLPKPDALEPPPLQGGGCPGLGRSAKQRRPGRPEVNTGASKQTRKAKMTFQQAPGQQNLLPLCWLLGTVPGLNAAPKQYFQIVQVDLPEVVHSLTKSSEGPQSIALTTVMICYIPSMGDSVTKHTNHRVNRKGGRWASSSLPESSCLEPQTHAERESFPKKLQFFKKSFPNRR